MVENIITNVANKIYEKSMFVTNLDTMFTKCLTIRTNTKVQFNMFLIPLNTFFSYLFDIFSTFQKNVTGKKIKIGIESRVQQTNQFLKNRMDKGSSSLKVQNFELLALKNFFFQSKKKKIKQFVSFLLRT